MPVRSRFRHRRNGRACLLARRGPPVLRRDARPIRRDAET